MQLKLHAFRVIAAILRSLFVWHLDILTQAFVLVFFLFHIWSSFSSGIQKFLLCIAIDCSIHVPQGDGFGRNCQDLVSDSSCTQTCLSGYVDNTNGTGQIYTCPQGIFHGILLQCTDFDECADQIAWCLPFHNCVNLVGSYVCLPRIELLSPFILTSMSGGDLVQAHVYFQTSITNLDFSLPFEEKYFLRFEYGNVSESVRFDVGEVIASASSSNEIICEFITASGYGAGLSVLLFWSLTASLSPGVGYASSGMLASSKSFRYPRPIITPRTLRLNSSSEVLFDDSGNCSFVLVPGNGLGYWVTFTGENFGFFSEQISVSYSDGTSNFPCTIMPAHNTVSPTLGKYASTYVICQTNTGELLGSYSFIVSVGGQISDPGCDFLIFPRIPVVLSVVGCVTQLGISTSDCPTRGGILITVLGEYFSQGAEVYVDGSECFIVTPIQEGSLVCLLPSGSGLFVDIIVRQKSDADSVLLSTPRKLLSYALPAITQLYHTECVFGSGSSLLFGCPRLGGGLLTLIGNNFGNSGAVVLVGSELCLNVIHVQDSICVQCILPPGTSISTAVVFIQAGGSLSSNDAKISYLACPPGTFQSGNTLTCQPCAIGTISSVSGLFACIPCPAGTFQTYGFSSCITCMAGYFATNPSDHCLPCEAGYFSGAGAAVCLSCMAGKYSSYSGAADCISCPTGKYSLFGGYECVACPPGKFSMFTGSLQCPDCPQGSSQSESEQTSCFSCIPGRFQYRIGQSYCDACEIGRFMAAFGSIQCTVCEAGKFQSHSARTLCENCLFGSYKATASTEECLDCAAGRYTSIDTTLYACALCQPGKMQPSTAAIECIYCDAGFFQSAFAETACVECTPGTYSSTAGESICAVCEAGRFQPQEGQSACIDCLPGKFKSVSDIGACLDCTPGSYTSSSTNKFVCGACEVGKIQPESASTSCLACDPGRYGEFGGASACLECEVGKYSEMPGLTACMVCEAGRFQSALGSSWCDNCMYGTFNGDANFGRCTNCPAGKFTSSATTLIVCAACEPGYFQNETGASYCHACWPGTYQAQSGSSFCELCDSGFYSSETGTSTCICCESGRFQPDRGQSCCESCKAGRFMLDIASNSSSCHVCPRGKAVAAVGSSSCEECRSSVDFQPDEGQQQCTVCPENSVAVQNHTSCLCNTGFFAVPFSDLTTFSALDPVAYSIYRRDYQNAVKEPNPYQRLGFWCTPCPVGCDCTVVGTAISTAGPLPGYFRGVDDTGMAYYSCFNDACLQNNSCSPGYAGPFCAECDEGFVLEEGFKCSRCPNFGISVITFIGGVSLLGFYLIYKLQDVKRGYQAVDVFLKICLSSIQTNIIALSYAFNWDDITLRFRNVQAQTASFGTAYFEIQCLVSTQINSFQANNFIALISPMFFALMMCLVIYVRKRFCSRNRSSAINKAKSTIVSSAAVILFVFQPFLVKRCAQIFSCVKLGSGLDDLFMVISFSIKLMFVAPTHSYAFEKMNDLSVRCWSSRAHWGYIIAQAFPLGALYVV
jgi:hypothetical protein